MADRMVWMFPSETGCGAFVVLLFLVVGGEEMRVEDVRNVRLW